MVYGYVLLILVATPYLPSLIQCASSRWSGGSVNRFVLGVEVSMGILLLVLAGGIFYYNRQKFLRFTLIAGGSIAAAFLFYRIIPNPYELTHLPEYAILSVLIVRAIRVGEGTNSVQCTGRHYSTVLRRRRTERERSGANLLYFRSSVFTTALGTVDELYQGLLPGRFFIWYDILLNGLGGVLGLMIVWGMSRK